MTRINKLTQNPELKDDDLFVIFDDENQRTRSIASKDVKEFVNKDNLKPTGLSPNTVPVVNSDSTNLIDSSITETSDKIVMSKTLIVPQDSLQIGPALTVSDKGGNLGLTNEAEDYESFVATNRIFETEDERDEIYSDGVPKVQYEYLVPARWTINFPFETQVSDDNYLSFILLDDDNTYIRKLRLFSRKAQTGVRIWVENILPEGNKLVWQSVTEEGYNDGKGYTLNADGYTEIDIGLIKISTAGIPFKFNIQAQPGETLNVEGNKTDVGFGEGFYLKLHTYTQDVRNVELLDGVDTTANRFGGFGDEFRIDTKKLLVREKGSTSQNVIQNVFDTEILTTRPILRFTNGDEPICINSVKVKHVGTWGPVQVSFNDLRTTNVEQLVDGDNTVEVDGTALVVEANESIIIAFSGSVGDGTQEQITLLGNAEQEPYFELSVTEINHKEIDSGIESIVAGENITIDNTDPKNPIISSEGGLAEVVIDKDNPVKVKGADGTISDALSVTDDGVFSIGSTSDQITQTKIETAQDRIVVNRNKDGSQVNEQIAYVSDLNINEKTGISYYFLSDTTPVPAGSYELSQEINGVTVYAGDYDIVTMDYKSSDSFSYTVQLGMVKEHVKRYGFGYQILDFVIDYKEFSNKTFYEIRVEVNSLQRRIAYSLNADKTLAKMGSGIDVESGGSIFAENVKTLDFDSRIFDLTNEGNDTVKVSVEQPNVTNFVGVFDSEQDLNNAFPSPEKGLTANVLVNNGDKPDERYQSQDGAWVSYGFVAGDVIVNDQKASAIAIGDGLESVFDLDNTAVISVSGNTPVLTFDVTEDSTRAVDATFVGKVISIIQTPPAISIPMQITLSDHSAFKTGDVIRISADKKGENPYKNYYFAVYFNSAQGAQRANYPSDTITLVRTDTDWDVTLGGTFTNTLIVPASQSTYSGDDITNNSRPVSGIVFVERGGVEYIKDDDDRDLIKVDIGTGGGSGDTFDTLTTRVLKVHRGPDNEDKFTQFSIDGNNNTDINAIGDTHYYRKDPDTGDLTEIYQIDSTNRFVVKTKIKTPVITNISSGSTNSNSENSAYIDLSKENKVNIGAYESVNITIAGEKIRFGQGAISFDDTGDGYIRNLGLLSRNSSNDRNSITFNDADLISKSDAHHFRDNDNGDLFSFNKTEFSFYNRNLKHVRHVVGNTPTSMFVANVSMIKRDDGDNSKDVIDFATDSINIKSKKVEFNDDSGARRLTIENHKADWHSCQLNNIADGVADNDAATVGQLNAISGGNGIPYLRKFDSTGGQIFAHSYPEGRVQAWINYKGDGSTDVSIDSMRPIPEGQTGQMYDMIALDNQSQNVCKLRLFYENSGTTVLRIMPGEVVQCWTSREFKRWKWQYGTESSIAGSTSLAIEENNDEIITPTKGTQFQIVDSEKSSSYGNANKQVTYFAPTVGTQSATLLSHLDYGKAWAIHEEVNTTKLILILHESLVSEIYDRDLTGVNELTMLFTGDSRGRLGKANQTADAQFAINWNGELIPATEDANELNPTQWVAQDDSVTETWSTGVKSVCYSTGVLANRGSAMLKRGDVIYSKPESLDTDGDLLETPRHLSNSLADSGETAQITYDDESEFFVIPIIAGGGTFNVMKLFQFFMSRKTQYVEDWGSIRFEQSSDCIGTILKIAYDAAIAEEEKEIEAQNDNLLEGLAQGFIYAKEVTAG